MSDEWKPLDPNELEESIELEELLEEHDEKREQELGAAPEAVLGSELDRDELSEEHILETSGLLSHVLSCDQDQNPETVGHILMTEWDGVDDAMIPLSIATQKPGISILLRSSGTNYHLYNLSVRSFAEQVRDVVAGTGDLGHARWSSRRGYFVLRILEKRHLSGDIYKPAPEMIGVYCSDSKYPQSERHLSLFESIAREREHSEMLNRLEDAREEHVLVGDRLRAEHYETLTDQLQGEL